MMPRSIDTGLRLDELPEVEIAYEREPNGRGSRPHRWRRMKGREPMRVRGIEEFNHCMPQRVEGEG